MELKDKIDLLYKRAELIYKKLLIFLAIAGGSWIYGLREQSISLTLIVLVAFVFVLSVIAIVLNLLKYGEIQKELKDL